jgi:hypothetical protein
MQPSLDLEPDGNAYASVTTRAILSFWKWSLTQKFMSVSTQIPRETPSTNASFTANTGNVVLLGSSFIAMLKGASRDFMIKVTINNSQRIEY